MEKVKVRTELKTEIKAVQVESNQPSVTYVLRTFLLNFGSIPKCVH